jgi:hypothetical protein
MWTTSNLKQELQVKPLEYREAFVKAANAALSRGRTAEESEFAGNVAVRILEQSNSKRDSVLLKSQVQQQKPPSHLIAVTKASELKKQATKAETLPSPSDRAKRITGVSFDAKGRLVVNFEDGSKIESNTLPVQEVIEQHITIQKKEESPVVGPGGVSEFDDINELDRTLTYTDGVLTRIDYESGNHKAFTYTSGVLTQVDYVKGSIIYRKTMSYDGFGNLTGVNYQII